MVLPLWACTNSATTLDAQAFTDLASSDAHGVATTGLDANFGEANAPTADAAKTDVPAAEAAAEAGSNQDAAVLADAQLSTDAAGVDTGFGAGDATASTCNLDGGPVSLVRLSPLELKTILASSENPYLFNVKGNSIPNIPGTDGVFASDAPSVEKAVGGDRCADIIVYCRSGVISQQVSAKLIADGYRRVRDLTGGILAWQAAGYPTQ
jgi:rhodanese-related sulfurtransferase